MQFKIIKAYLKYKLGLTNTLPAFVINSVKECDNKEQLVNIKKEKIFIFFGKRLKSKKQVFLRESVVKKLIHASHLLPDNIFFIIYDAYRPLSEQKDLWNKKYKYYQKLYPNETTEQITIRTKRVVADPRHGHGGHQTGGAVDIGLCDKNGVELDMGTAHSGNGPMIKTKAKVNKTVKRNRTILCKVMEKCGFVNYPNEWWHFCYGDRMWAAYSMKKTCFYGLFKE